MKRLDGDPDEQFSLDPLRGSAFSNSMAGKKKTRTPSRKGTKKRSRGKKVAKPGPGRRLTPADQERRLDALKKHGGKDSPKPLTGHEIAKKLGIKVGTWNVWKSNQKKGAGLRSPARRGRPRKAASSLDVVIAGFREIERERDQLRKVLEKVRNALAEVP